MTPPVSRKVGAEDSVTFLAMIIAQCLPRSFLMRVRSVLLPFSLLLQILVPVGLLNMHAKLDTWPHKSLSSSQSLFSRAQSKSRQAHGAIADIIPSSLRSNDMHGIKACDGISTWIQPVWLVSLVCSGTLLPTVQCETIALIGLLRRANSRTPPAHEGGL